MRMIPKFLKTTVLSTIAVTGLITFSMTAQAAEPAYSLKVLHINDHHSRLDPNARMSLDLDGKSTRVQSGGFPRVVSLFDQLSAGHSNVLKLHAGDAITGDLYYTLFKGEADAAMMNQICFDAFTVGNHEFDAGDAGLKEFIDFLHAGSCQTPVISANVVPAIGTPLAPESTTDYIKPYTIQEVGGEQIGIVGLTIANKTQNSSSPDETTLFLDEVEAAQRQITDLKNEGVDKIIVMTHYQYMNDLALAQSLHGVDVIVGGDSHTLLGDFDAIGLNTDGAYPTIIPNADGKNVCVVQAWQYSQIVGELDVTFNRNGDVIGCRGVPHMPIANSFKRRDENGDRVEIRGADRGRAIAAVDAHPSLHIVREDAATVAILSEFQGQVDTLKQTKIGSASENLCLERIPGQGRSSICDVSETAQNGSDISTLVAHAFRQMSKTSDIAIQNGGGVRVDLAAGDVTIGDAYTLLPFANTLVELNMTGAEIKAVLEDALDFALSPDGSTGAYPYAAGLRWDVVASEAKGNRIQNLAFKGRDGGSWAPIDMGASYLVVTNNFISAGRDGYSTFRTVVDDNRATDTYLDYAQSFVDYVQSIGTISKLPVSEYSTQSFTP